jgi:antitoxin ParD1/3/4
MDVTLSNECEAFVREQLARGRYSTHDEVVCEALRLLRRHEELDRLKLEELRQLVAVGLEQAESGDVAPLDMEAIRAEGRRRLMERNNAQPAIAPSPADGASAAGPA